MNNTFALNTQIKLNLIKIYWQGLKCTIIWLEVRVFLLPLVAVYSYCVCNYGLINICSICVYYLSLISVRVKDVSFKANAFFTRDPHSNFKTHTQIYKNCKLKPWPKKLLIKPFLQFHFLWVSFYNINLHDVITQSAQCLGPSLIWTVRPTSGKIYLHTLSFILVLWLLWTRMFIPFSIAIHICLTWQINRFN